MLYDLEVPDFTAAPLDERVWRSSSSRAPETPTVVPKNPLGQFLPGPPTAAREFARDDELALFAEFYENAPSARPTGSTSSTTVRAEDGRVVFEDREERSVDASCRGLGAATATRAFRSATLPRDLRDPRRRAVRAGVDPVRAVTSSSDQMKASFGFGHSGSMR